jgi:hypothetical protein
VKRSDDPFRKKNPAEILERRIELVETDECTSLDTTVRLLDHSCQGLSGFFGDSFFKNIFVANGFISPLNTQTRHIKSFYTQQHCYVSLKNLIPWRDSNPGLLVPQADAMSIAPFHWAIPFNSRYFLTEIHIQHPPKLNLFSLLTSKGRLSSFI